MNTVAIRVNIDSNCNTVWLQYTPRLAFCYMMEVCACVIVLSKQVSLQSTGV